MENSNTLKSNNSLFRGLIYKLKTDNHNIDLIGQIKSQLDELRAFIGAIKIDDVRAELGRISGELQQGNIPQFWTTNTNTIWKTDQSIFK